MRISKLALRSNPELCFNYGRSFIKLINFALNDTKSTCSQNALHNEQSDGYN